MARMDELREYEYKFSHRISQKATEKLDTDGEKTALKVDKSRMTRMDELHECGMEDLTCL